MLPKRFDCLAIGDVMIDVFMSRLTGRAPIVPRGTSYCPTAKIELGGVGNVAAGLSRLGRKASFVGKAGDDLWGRIYEENLNANGVSTRVFFERGASTGIAFVDLCRKGERSFLVSRGANDMLSSKEIDRTVGLLGKSQYLYLSGYSLVANPQKDAIIHALHLAKKNDVKVIFDPGAYNLINSNSELFNELFHSCEVFCPNLDEAKATFKTHYLETVIRELRNANKLTALKCGVRGCIMISEAECFRVPGFKVNCLDTTGAGDAFAAGLICGMAKGLPLYATGKLANWFASRVVTRVGARGFPSMAEAQSFLKKLEWRDYQV